MERSPHDIVRLNRAVVTAELDGPDAALAEIDGLDSAALDGYLPFHVARAELLSRLGRTAEADVAFDRAIERTTNPVEREHLSRRRSS